MSKHKAVSQTGTVLEEQQELEHEHGEPQPLGGVPAE